MRRVLKRLPTKRQTLFFSATIPPAIAALVSELLRDPVRVDLAPKGAPAAGVTQIVYTINQNQKNDLLLKLLEDNTIYSAIVFTRTKSRANRLAATLGKHHIPADRIHGDRSQAQRTRALADFKGGKYRVLVATDIAARGIDIAELGHVINYDVPMVAEDYIHRVGRTARAKATGDAITFVAHDEEKYFAQNRARARQTIGSLEEPRAAAAHAASADRARAPVGRTSVQRRRSHRRTGARAVASHAPRTPPAPNHFRSPYCGGSFSRVAASFSRAFALEPGTFA